MPPPRKRPRTPDPISPEHVALGAAIVAARERAGMSQSELAKQAKLARSAVSDIELARRSASFSSLLSIAAALDTPLSKLMHDYEHRRKRG